MKVLSLKDGYDVWLTKVRKYGYSRWPVSEDGDPDRIVGYVYVKDVLMAGPERVRSVGALRRDIVIVPGGSTVGAVLELLQSSNIPIGLVVDEYGGTAGLVTLEDIVVEFLGNVRDEITGSVLPGIERAVDGSVIAHGAAPIDELELEGARLEGEEGTVSRFVLDRLGRLASPGDTIDLGKWHAIVEDVRAQRVHRVRFRRGPAPEPDSDT